jgi:hypothetical protein
VAGDDALLELCRLRFAQSGLAAEIYAGSPAELEHVLRFAPRREALPMVHLSRAIDLLEPGGQRAVRQVVRAAGDRVRGFVVHDRRHMPERMDDLSRVAEELSGELTRAGEARLFVEYAAGNRIEDFVAIGRRLAGGGRVGLCIDTGHVGVRAARWAFAARRPDLDLDLIALTAADPRLPALVEDVRAAVAEAAPAVTGLIRDVAAQGAPVHFHLHDGHPLVDGLADHFGFLGRQPVPFDVDGRRSLPNLYGPGGLRAILQEVVCTLGERASITFEIHQGYGRLGLDAEAGALFGHWRDLTTAEQTNAHLAQLAENADLARSMPALDGRATVARAR